MTPPLQRKLPLDATFRRPSKRAAVDLAAELLRTRLDRDNAVATVRRLFRELARARGDLEVLRGANERLRARVVELEQATSAEAGLAPGPSERRSGVAQGVTAGETAPIADRSPELAGAGRPGRHGASLRDHPGRHKSIQ